MEGQELQKYQLVQSFLQSIKQAQSKQQFLSRVNEFDSRFIEDHSAPPTSEKQKSVEKLPPMPQEKPKNPFKSNIDDNFRHQNMAQTGQHFPQPSPFAHQQPVRGNYSRTQQNFYRGQQAPQVPNPRNEQGIHSQSHIQQQYGGGMGILNYNAFSQREYDELKEQFFRPPMPRPLQPYNRMSQDTVFNFGQMGMGLGASSSSDLLPGETSFSKPTPRGYADRMNAFMKQ